MKLCKCQPFVDDLCILTNKWYLTEFLIVLKFKVSDFKYSISESRKKLIDQKLTKLNGKTYNHPSGPDTYEYEITQPIISLSLKYKFF